MYLYNTFFGLSYPVKNVVEAREFLNLVDLTELLVEQFPQLKNLVESIRWSLVADNFGGVFVESRVCLRLDEKLLISEFISEQCSEGLGVDFSSQSFAEFEEHFTDEFGYEDSAVRKAEFDWRENPYHLRLVRQC